MHCNFVVYFAHLYCAELEKKRLGAGLRSGNVHESSNPDALGNSTAIGGNISEVGGTSVATTTKHPRHRPGCSCIVCIQPPSGKGKHKPTCTCNVCMTVKRRFKTLMMRKKKRQSEREAEIAQRNQFVWERKEEGEAESIGMQLATPIDSLEDQRRLGSELQIISQNNTQSVEIGNNGKLDLNSHPDRENLQMKSSRISMVSLLQEASLPLETYLKQNGLTSLVSDQQASSGSHVLQPANRDSENLSHGVQEPEDGSEELSETDQSGKDPS